MPNPQVLEDAIVDRLKTVFQSLGVEVLPLPDDAEVLEETKGIALTKGRVMVAYSSSVYEAQEDSRSKNFRATGAIVQDQVPEIEIALEARRRRGPGSVLEFLDIARRALVGWKPAGSGYGKLFAVRDAYGGLDDGLWSYTLTLKSSALLVEAEEPAVLPRLNTITHERT